MLDSPWKMLDPWKIIVFSVIKPLDSLCKLLKKLMTKKQKERKKRCPGCFSGRRTGTPLTKIPGSAYESDIFIQSLLIKSIVLFGPGHEKTCL